VPDLILDGFAGPGGWAEGLRTLGLTEVGLEWDAAACATRVAAGHRMTVRCDVAQYPTAPFTGRVKVKVDSPPCQAWSRAGKGLGLVDQPLVHQAVADLAAGRDTRTELKAQCKDPRSILAAEPMRWHHDLRPETILMEEVPDVLPLWRQYAAVLRGWGYSVWCGILNAADYGVPQTRRRAILIASRVRDVTAPAATHAEHAEPDGLFGPGRARWVSMAQALGWGATDRPVPTVTAGGGKTGGAEPFPSQARAALLASQERGDWVLRNGNQPNAAVRAGDEPAPTMVFGNNSARVEWVLRTGNNSERGGGALERYERPVTEPAPTLDTGAGGKWTLQSGPDTVRITQAEAAVLQTFRPDYPWQGTKTKQFEQIGNAVPPLFAAHIAAAGLGINIRERTEVAA
jgi:DNA (cytosine-5)-methyltransferase 1